MCDGDEATRREYADELADVLSDLPTDGSNDVALLSRKEFERKQTALRDLDDARAVAASAAAATGAPAPTCAPLYKMFRNGDVGCVLRVWLPPLCQETCGQDTVAGGENEPAGTNGGQRSASTEPVASVNTEPAHGTDAADNAVAHAEDIAGDNAAATKTTADGTTPPSESAHGALPSLLCVFGAGRTGRTTLGKQLAAIPGYHVMEYDGWRTTWPNWAALDCAPGTHTIVLLCHDLMRAALALFPKYAGVMHHCHLLHDGSACDFYERLYPYIGLGHQVMMHRAVSSSPDCPTWTVTHVHGHVPWLAHVPHAF
jgi:hypothetical protein